ncbi:MAG: GNAT family N-acetyltransferase [Ktedonobacteraceae bacterium]
MERLNIRPAYIADTSRLATLMEQLGYPTEDLQMEERLNGILSRADYQTFVAEISDQVVGMIGLHIGHYYEKDGLYGQIVALVVQQDFQGRRIGSSLVAEGERWLQKQGIHTVIVNSGNTRVVAHQFYERLGYQATGIRFVKTRAEVP